MLESSPTRAESPPESQAESGAESLGGRLRLAYAWRAGSALLVQIVQWASTFLVIRLLTPADYGLFAMTQVVLGLLSMFAGHGLATGLIQRADVPPRLIAQVFGLLILVNAALAAVQLALAPLAAAYYHAPQVALLLQVQCLLYLVSPLLTLTFALLTRRLDYRTQGLANVAGALGGALTALGGAFAGWGVWALVFAPIAMFSLRAAVMVAATGLPWPSFDFRGAGGVLRYGWLVAASQLFWFAESQADILIGGAWFSAHLLGIYTTSLFLTQIFVSKVVPPLNEVAFAAYARMQHDGDALARAFERGLRVIMVAALPFYAGLAATAEPLIATMLGPQWLEAVPVVRLLCASMPFVTLQVLLPPACEARGRPEIGVGNGAIGAVLLTCCYLVGVRFGPVGLAASWLAAYPAYLIICLRRTLPVIGATSAGVARAILPPLAAALIMGAGVALAQAQLAALAAAPRLALLVPLGVALYAGALALLAPRRLGELVALVRRSERAA